MEILLRAKGLWEHVEETVNTDTVTNGKAQALIVLSLDDSQLIHCIRAKSAKEAWLILKMLNE